MCFTGSCLSWKRTPPFCEVPVQAGALALVKTKEGWLKPLWRARPALTAPRRPNGTSCCEAPKHLWMKHARTPELPCSGELGLRQWKQKPFMHKIYPHLGLLLLEWTAFYLKIREWETKGQQFRTLFWQQHKKGSRKHETLVKSVKLANQSFIFCLKSLLQYLGLRLYT